MKRVSLRTSGNVLFDNAPGTITNVIGIVNQSEFSVIEMKTLKNLTHQSLGMWNSATPDNPSVVAGGGTAIFRVVKLIQFGNYTAANRNDAGDTPKSEIKVKADIAGQEIAKYEVESLDKNGMEFATQSAFLSSVAAGVSTSLAALMDAHYIDAIVKDATAKQAANANTPAVVVNPDLLDLNTEVKQKAAYRQIARSRVGITRLLGKYNIGSEKQDYTSMFHEFVTIDLLLAMPKGGNSATEVGKKLTTDGFNTQEVAGLGPVKDHIYFGQNIPAGSSFSKNTSFDFTKVAGIIAHKEAVFVALQGLTTVARINGAGNQEIITKFNFFKKMVRDELYRVFATAKLA